MKIIFSRGPVPPPPIPLADLPLGGHAVVVGIDAPPDLVHRLEALGFLPATEVTCRRRAPLGEPRVYELRGTQLCLRRSEAARIRVEPRSR
jgi:ferrous iron transport protein A